MKKLIANLIVIVVALCGIGVFYYTIMGYFVSTYGNPVHDGLGRQLYEPPLWIRFIWPGFQFAGYKWFFIDIVGFWVFVLLAVGLISLSSKLKEAKEPSM